MPRNRQGKKWSEKETKKAILQYLSHKEIVKSGTMILNSVLSIKMNNNVAIEAASRPNIGTTVPVITLTL